MGAPVKSMLYICPRLPYPLVGGDKLKTHYALQGLALRYKVDLLVIDNLDDEKVEEYKRISGLNNIIYFKKSKFGHLLASLKTAWNGCPLQVNYYQFRDVQRYIDKHAPSYDIVFSNLIRTAKYSLGLKVNKVLDMVDSIGQNYSNSQNNTSSLFWRIVYKFESKRLLKFERLCVEEYDKTLFVNPFEKEYFARPEKTIWTQQGVQERLFAYSKKDTSYEGAIAFFGKMNYQPNVDAVNWFCDNVLKYIPHTRFIIVGAEPTSQVLNLQNRYPNVIVTGFLDDPFEIINSCKFLVAPMQTGAGIQNKVLEGMALGKAVILSSLAAKPILDGANLQHFFVEDDPEKIAQIILESTDEMIAKLGEQAKEFIVKRYSWRKYGEGLVEIADDILRKKR